MLLLPLIAKWYAAKWIIDWHNLGYSLLAMTYGPRHPLVRLARTLEYGLGSLADAHLCVTEALKADLLASNPRFASTSISVCRDHPAPIFRRSTPKEIQNVRKMTRLDCTHLALFTSDIGDVCGSF
jgi:hypothetical protein